MVSTSISHLWMAQLLLQYLFAPLHPSNRLIFSPHRDGAGWCINQRSRMERAENKNKAMKKRVVIEVQLDVWCVLLRTIVHKFEADQSDAQATTTGWPLQAVCTYPGCSWLGLGFQFANLAKLLQDYNGILSCCMFCCFMYRFCL